MVLGVVIATGIKKYPTTDDYWSTHPILGCRAITKVGFHATVQLYTLDRDHVKDDKLRKVCSVLDQVIAT